VELDGLLYRTTGMESSSNQCLPVFPLANTRLELKKVPLHRSLLRSSGFDFDSGSEEHWLTEDGQLVAQYEDFW
jgi:hypothetical protein